MSEERLLTARELAGQLAVSTGALLRWTRAGNVPPAVKMPSGAWRYRPELIGPWLDKLAKGANGASRGVSPTRNADRPGGAYEEGHFDSSPTTLRDAARDEEEDHAS